MNQVAELRPSAREQRNLEGCKNYAAFDKSDPFTYNRAMTHTANGVAGLDANGNDAFYTATPYQEERHLPEGQTFSDGTSNSFHVTVYRDAKKP